jgi:ribosomal-protein-serine acetyltransferase
MPEKLPYFTRRFRQEDAPSFLAAVRASLPGLAQSMPWCKLSYSLEDATAWIVFAEEAWSTQKEYPLGIFESSSGAVVGGTGINQINRTHSIGNIGYWVSTPHTGRGVAKLAARQAAWLGFEQLGLNRLEIVALTENIASQRVALGIGATFECIARNRLYAHGRAQAAMIYSLTPQDTKAWRSSGASVFPILS